MFDVFEAYDPDDFLLELFGDEDLTPDLQWELMLRPAPELDHAAC